jgi:hypothetical protein
MTADRPKHDDPEQADAMVVFDSTTSDNGPAVIANQWGRAVVAAAFPGIDVEWTDCCDHLPDGWQLTCTGLIDHRTGVVELRARIIADRIARQGADVMVRDEGEQATRFQLMLAAKSNGDGVH